ncbi:hypothetical protein [Candidatus Thiothrix anitrata]|jgi:hypothetical protein|uniref:Uncharacterized protein n=1 Tax=Candidatus Thiothrix anitrata TaxID=2823902 RepID=A0ABX7X6P1_9GAMM|nr:hypothetical protein [Candidatus Thiothrix anitrata]QTR50423.1 hypothetical protein J8380_02235 [Candidatus Thiothrix anitrata]
MKNNRYAVIFPHISENTKFIAVLCAMLLGSALIAGLGGTQTTHEMAQEEKQAPEVTEKIG